MSSNRAEPKLFSEAHWQLGVTPPEALRIRSTIERLPNQIDRLIDVGGGDGRFLDALVASGFDGELVLSDYSPSAVRRARFASIRSDAASLPFRDNAADCVVCCEVLEHLQESELRRAVLELIRVSARYILVTVPWNEQLEKNLVRCPRCGERFDSHGHLRSFQEEDVYQLFQDCRVLRLEVIGRRTQREYSPALLALKQRVFGLWADRDHISCPKCGYADFRSGSSKLLRGAFAALNLIANPRKHAGGWVFGLFEKRGSDRPGRSPGEAGLHA